MTVIVDAGNLARHVLLRHIACLTLRKKQVPRVINMGKVRNLLTEWEKVRRHILAGHVTGFQATLMEDGEAETLYVGGVYADDSHKATRALLRASAVRAMMQDEPPLFQASKM